MRIQVQVEWQGRPWRKCEQIRRMAFADAIFGILVAILYTIKIAMPNLEPELPGVSPAERLNNSLLLVFLVAANLIQTCRETGRDPTTCFEAAKTWYDYTEFGYLFAIVKCVITVSYIFKVAPHPWILALLAVTLPEVVFFKLYMLFTVYGFMKDLKQSLKYLPKFKFTPVAPSVSSSVQELTPDEKFYDINIVDVNANTKLLNMV